MAKSLYEAMKDCQKEEEVKSEFCKFFKMKINALKAIDHYTPNVLFEFKLDRNFRKTANIAVVIAQTMYYARLLKFSLTKFLLPPTNSPRSRRRTTPCGKSFFRRCTNSGSSILMLIISRNG